MNVGMIAGLALLIGAFIAAAAEMAAQARLGSFGLISAYETLYTLLPGKLIVAEIYVDKYLSPLVWDTAVRGILALPGWAILGVPGALIAWFSRPDRGTAYEDDDQMPYTTYEDILAAAEELEFEDLDDIGSKYRDYEEYDPAGVLALESVDDYMEQWNPARPPEDEGEFLLPPPAKPGE